MHAAADIGLLHIFKGGGGYGTYVERQGFAKMSNAQGHIREEVRIVYAWQ